MREGQDTFGSLNASISPLNSLIGTQEQNTFLSPHTLSTRATGGQYFCCLSEGSGNAASSRGYACVHSLADTCAAVCGACLSGLSSRSMRPSSIARISSRTGIIESQKRSSSARSGEHTSELQSLMSISYHVFCVKTKNL